MYSEILISRFNVSLTSTNIYKVVLIVHSLAHLKRTKSHVDIAIVHM